MMIESICKVDVMNIVGASLLAPTSFNLQHWRIGWTSEERSNRLIYSHLRDTHQLVDTPLNSQAQAFIGIFGEQAVWQEAAKYASHLPTSLEQAATLKSNFVYANNPRVQRDEMFRSAGFSALNMMWKAEQLGFGAKVVSVQDVSILDDIWSLDKKWTWLAGVLIDRRLPLKNSQNREPIDVQMFSHGELLA